MDNGHDNGHYGAIAFTLTNLIKLGGLVLVVNESLLQSGELRPPIIAVAAFMMAGATGLNSFFQSFLGRRNGNGKQEGRGE